MNKQMSRNKQNAQKTQAKQKAGNKQASQNGVKQSGTQKQSNQVPTSRQASRRAIQQAAKQQQRLEEQRQAARSRMITILSVVGAFVVVIAVAVGIILYNQSHSSAETVVNPSYPPVDGIYCDTLEQTAYHVHALLSITINGKAVSVPQGVGIASDGSCFYWLHTHDTSGVIHIEAPANRSFTLGNFIDEWKSPQFSQLNAPPELDFSSGWQVWVDGKPYSGDFHKIQLQAHEIITLAYNSPGVKPVTTYAWNGL